MRKFNRIFVFLFFTGLLMGYTPLTWAESCYGSKIVNKGVNAFANLTTSFLEIPKNMINTTNQSNFIYGIGGGFIKGAMNFFGRTGVGVVDLVTLPIPTRPIAQPAYIWDNFDVDTSYWPIFRLDQTTCGAEPVFVQESSLPVIAAPMSAAPEPIDNSKQYNQETSRKLDALYQQKMMK